MSVKKYDLIFSLGFACLCSSMLRKKNLQFYSYPLDWVIGGDFPSRVDLLVSDFENYLNKEDLYFTGKSNGLEHAPCETCINKRTNITHLHDFPLGVPFEESFPAVKAKYERRISRLIGNINRFKDILIVYVIPFPVPAKEDLSDETLSECYNKIITRFPNKNIDILYIQSADEFLEHNIGEHIKKIYFNFQRPNTEPPFDVRKLRTLVNNYRLRQTLSERIGNFVFKMKKRTNRWKKKILNRLSFRSSPQTTAK